MCLPSSQFERAGERITANWTGQLNVPLVLVAAEAGATSQQSCPHDASDRDWRPIEIGQLPEGVRRCLDRRRRRHGSRGAEACPLSVALELGPDYALNRGEGVLLESGRDNRHPVEAPVVVFCSPIVTPTHLANIEESEPLECLAGT